MLCRVVKTWAGMPTSRGFAPSSTRTATRCSRDGGTPTKYAPPVPRRGPISGHDGTVSTFRRAWLGLLKHTLNRATVPLARAGIGPFSLVRHVGRKTGRTYETPLLLARAGGDFVAELT